MLCRNSDIFAALLTLVFCARIVTGTGDESEELYGTFPRELMQGDIPIRFGGQFKTYMTFEPYNHQILHSVLETRGVLHVDSKEHFFMNPLLFKNRKSFDDFLNESDCNKIPADPNTFLRYLTESQGPCQPSHKCYGGKESTKAVSFSAITLNYAENGSDSRTFLAVKTSFDRIIYSSPFMTKENENKQKVVVLVGRTKDLKQYTYGRTRSPYTFKGVQRITRYHGSIDITDDECGTKDSQEAYCSYLFKKEGITVEYQLYRTEMKPMVSIDPNGNKHYIFFNDDSKVAQRFAANHNLKCQNQKGIPQKLCDKRKEELRKLYEDEKLATSGFDFLQDRYSELDCSTEVLTCSTAAQDIKPLTHYNQQMPQVALASHLVQNGLSSLVPDSKGVCFTGFSGTAMTFEHFSRSFSQNRLINGNMFLMNRDANSFKSVLVESDYYPKELRCKQFDINSTQFNELWIQCDLPRQFANIYYDLIILFHNVDHSLTSRCEKYACFGDVYDMQYDDESHKWIFKFRGQKLKGRYELSLEYTFRQVNTKSGHDLGIQTTSLSVNKIGIYNEYLRIFYSIIYFLANMCAIALVLAAFEIRSCYKNRDENKEKFISDPQEFHHAETTTKLTQL